MQLMVIQSMIYSELAQRLKALEASTGQGFAEMHKVLNTLLEDKEARGE